LKRSFERPSRRHRGGLKTTVSTVLKTVRLGDPRDGLKTTVSTVLKAALLTVLLTVLLTALKMAYDGGFETVRLDGFEAVFLDSIETTSSRSY
jgi:hypothetical protein